MDTGFDSGPKSENYKAKLKQLMDKARPNLEKTIGNFADGVQLDVYGPQMKVTSKEEELKIQEFNPHVFRKWLGPDEFLLIPEAGVLNLFKVKEGVIRLEYRHQSVGGGNKPRTIDIILDNDDVNVIGNESMQDVYETFAPLFDEEGQFVRKTDRIHIDSGARSLSYYDRDGNELPKK